MYSAFCISTCYDVQIDCLNFQLRFKCRNDLLSILLISFLASLNCDQTVSIIEFRLKYVGEYICSATCISDAVFNRTLPWLSQLDLVKISTSNRYLKAILNIKGIIHQKYIFSLNLIFWIVVICDLAHCKGVWKARQIKKRIILTTEWMSRKRVVLMRSVVSGWRYNSYFCFSLFNNKNCCIF